MSSQSFSQLLTVNLQYSGIKIMKQCSDVNCVKHVPIRGWSGPYYTTFWVNTGTYSPNGHTTSNPRRFDMDITSIRRRQNFHEFPRHFRVLFRCDFDGRKIHVVSTYFFRCNFAGRKIHVVSTYFFRCNFSGRKIRIVSMYFFRGNFDGQRFDIVFGKL